MGYTYGYPAYNLLITTREPPSNDPIHNEPMYTLNSKAPYPQGARLDQALEAALHDHHSSEPTTLNPKP